MVYDISENRSTAMAMNKELFNSCKASKTKGDELTEVEFRRNVDLAWRITEEFAGKKGKVNKVEEIKPVASSDHEPCQDCGSTDFLRTGTCFVCRNCSASQGCS